jgi:phosphonate dehydrogenase
MPPSRGIPQVVVTHWVHDEVLDYLRRFCDPLAPARDEGIWPRERVKAAARDVEGLVTCMADSVDDAFLAGCPRLRVIAATLKGHDNFDVEACTRRGVWLTILPEMLTVPTAELAIGLVIGILRRVGEADRHVRRGAFAGWRPELYGRGLHEATAGIIGMGRLGQAVAHRLGAFGTRVVYADDRPVPGADRFPLDDVLRQSDVVLPLLPLTAGTRHLLDRRALQLLRPGAFLVNVGRGSVVDEEAVADALHEGRLGGYAADVFAMEDWLLPGHPDRIPQRLLDHPRTLFTPHLGSAVDSVRRDMSLRAAGQVEQALLGVRPDLAVNEPATIGA